MKVVFLVLFGLSSLFSFSQSEKLVEIQLLKTHDYKHELKLSDIAIDISYIPLETNNNVLIGNRFSQPKLTNDYIFIQTGGVLFQFDKKGKFIRKINKLGQGPQECSVRDFGIDEKNQLIYIFDNWNLGIYIFNFLGKYVKTIRNPFSNESDGNSPSHMGSDVQGNLLFSFDNGQGQTKYKYVSVNSVGKIIYKSPNYIRYTLKEKVRDRSVLPLPIYEYNKSNYYKYCYNDTIFKINADYSCTPVYILNLPNKITLEEDMKTGAGVLEYSALSNKNMFSGVREDKKYLYIYHSYNPYNRNYVSLLSIYDKQGKQLLGNVNPTIKNNFDGGMDIKLSPESQNENTVYIMLQPFKMKEVLTNSYFTKTTAVYSEKKNALRNLVNQLEDEDNPVLMIIQLK
jgi:hypothetical protein